MRHPAASIRHERIEWPGRVHRCTIYRRPGGIEWLQREPAKRASEPKIRSTPTARISMRAIHGFRRAGNG